METSTISQAMPEMMIDAKMAGHPRTYQHHFMVKRVSTTRVHNSEYHGHSVDCLTLHLEVDVMTNMCLSP